MYPTKITDLPVSIRARATMERRIVRSLVQEFSEQGFTFLVDDGEEEIRCSTPKAALKALVNTDEDRLGIVKPDGKELGWILLIYGNDGWDVMGDYHCVLESYMPKTLALVNTLSE